MPNIPDYNTFLSHKQLALVRISGAAQAAACLFSLALSFYQLVFLETEKSFNRKNNSHI